MGQAGKGLDHTNPSAPGSRKPALGTRGHYPPYSAGPGDPGGPGGWTARACWRPWGPRRACGQAERRGTDARGLVHLRQRRQRSRSADRPGAAPVGTQDAAWCVDGCNLCSPRVQAACPSPVPARRHGSLRPPPPGHCLWAPRVTLRPLSPRPPSPSVLASAGPA